MFIKICILTLNKFNTVNQILRLDELVIAAAENCTNIHGQKQKINKINLLLFFILQ